jgi:hypothetical protein
MQLDLSNVTGDQLGSAIRVTRGLADSLVVSGDMPTARLLTFVSVALNHALAHGKSSVEVHTSEPDTDPAVVDQARQLACVAFYMLHRDHCGTSLGDLYGTLAASFANARDASRIEAIALEQLLSPSNRVN